MVKIIYIFLYIVFLNNKVLAASNNLFFTTAQFITYCKSNNTYEKGICDGYIIAINDVIFSLKKENVDICLPQNLSIKKIGFSIMDYIIDNAELMSVEANKVIGKFFLINFKCR